MEILDNKTNAELQKSMLGELAKTKNELSCAQGDLQKIASRISFLLVTINKLIEREERKD